MSRQTRWNARRRNRRCLSRQLEALEARRVLAGFNLTDDVADGEAGSLRDAVIQSNSNGEDDVITLTIKGPIHMAKTSAENNAKWIDAVNVKNTPK